MLPSDILHVSIRTLKEAGRLIRDLIPSTYVLLYFYNTSGRWFIVINFINKENTYSNIILLNRKLKYLSKYVGPSYDIVRVKAQISQVLI